MQIEKGQHPGIADCLDAHGADVIGKRVIIEPIKTKRAFTAEELILIERARFRCEVEDILAEDQAMVSVEIAVSEEYVHDLRSLETPTGIITDPYGEESGPHVTYKKLETTILDPLLLRNAE